MEVRMHKDAPGPAEQNCGGFIFRRGEATAVPDALGAEIASRPGFSEVKAKAPSKSKEK